MTTEELEKRSYEFRSIVKKIVCSANFREKSELQQAEKGVLFCLFHMSKVGCVSPSQLAKEMNLTQPAITHQINSLEKKGLIERSFSDTDRRKNFLNLSEKGTNLIEIIRSKDRERIRKMIEFLGKEDSDKLMMIFRKISAYLDEEKMNLTQTKKESLEHDKTV